MSGLGVKKIFSSLLSASLLSASLILFTACGAKTQIDENYFPTVQVSYLNSALTSSSSSVVSGEVVTLSLDLRDTNFSSYISRLPVVIFTASGGTSTGVIGSTVNHGNGTYTAAFTGLAAGTATTIHAFVNGIEIQNTLPSITVISGNYSLANSDLSLSSGSVNSGSTITATVTVKDNSNNQFTNGGLTVTFTNAGGTSTGTWSATTDHNDGTYSAVFTGALVGSATTVSGRIQSSAIAQTAQLAVIGGPALASATVTDSSPTASTTYHLTYGAVTNAYDRYCILENDTTLSDCAFITGSLPATYTVTSTNGTKTLSFWLKDVAGNISARVNANSVDLYISTPTVTISTPAMVSVINAASALTAYTVSGTCSENGRTVTVQVTDGSSTVTPATQPTCSSLSYSTTLNLSSLSDGNLTFKADHTNIVATSAVQASVVVSKDTQVPTLASASISNSTPTNSTTFNLTYGSQGGGTYASYCILENATTVGSCSWVAGTLPSTDTVSSTNNSKTLSVWIKDQAGNISTRVDTGSVTLDTVVPTLASIAITDTTPANSTTYNLSFGATTDTYATYCILENSTAVGSCSWVVGTLPSVFTVSSTNNAKTLSAWIKDTAGNISARVDSNSVTLDTVLPGLASATITDSSPTASQTYHLSFGAITDSYISYCILENSTTLASCSFTLGTLPSTYTVGAVSNAKVLSIWLKDSAGNLSSRVDTNSVTLNTGVPGVTIAAPTMASVINSLSAVTAYPVSGSCSENGRTVTIAVTDGSTTVNPTTQPTCSSLTFSTTVNLTTLSNGTITFKADHDNAALTPATQSTVSVAKDTQVPTLASVSISNASPTSSTSFGLSYGALTGGTYDSYCILENSTTVGSCSFITGSLPSTYAVTSTNNAKTLSIWLKDTAGNVSTRVDTGSVTLDTVTPSLASAAISNASPTNSTTYNLTYGAITDSYTSYCILENSTTVGSCSWTVGTLPTTYSVTATNNAKVLSVWIRDGAGNTATRIDTNSVTLDTVTPTLASASISNTSPSDTQTYDLTYGAITDSYTSYCILENSTTVGSCSWTVGTLPVSFNVASTNNAKVLSVWIKDAANNISTRVDTGSVTLDTVTPSLASASITNSSPTSSMSFALSYGAVTDSYTSYCILENSTTIASCSWTAGTLPSTYTVTSTNNSKTISLWLKDAAGNISSRVDTGSVTLDTVVPTLASATLTDASPTNSTTYNLNYGATTDIYASYCILENSTTVGSCTFTTGTLPSTFTVTSTNNAKVLSVWIKDAAGNVSTRVDTGSVTLDTVAPTLASATITNATPTNSTTYNLTYGAVTDSYATYCILENSTTVGSCSWTAGTVPATYSVTSTNNAKVLSVWLKDTAGNVSTRVDTGSVTLNTSTPTVTIGAPTVASVINNASALTAYTVSGACSENGRTVTVQVTDGSTTVTPTTQPTCSSLAYTTTVNVTTLADGSLTFKADHDNAATTVATQASVVVSSKDTQTPTLASATIGNTTPTNTTTFSLTYGTQAGGTYASYCVLENSTTVGSCSWTTGTLPFTFTVTSTNNAKVLSVWIKDTAGNISTRVDTGSVTLDTVTPTLASATISNSSPTATTTYNLTYGAVTDTYASYCILENSTTLGSCSFTAGTLPATYAVTSTNNAKVLSVWIKDSAGNVSSRVDTNSVTLTTSVPTVTISAPTVVSVVNASSALTAYTVSGTCSENTRTVTVTITDGTTTVTPTTQPTCSSLAYTTTVNITSLSDGTITARANHTNSAGTPATQASVAFTKDTVVPVVSITTPTAGAVANASNYTAFTVSGSCTENSVTVSVAATDGTHTVTATPTCATASTPRWTTSLNLNTMNTGSVTLSATQTDAAGNAGSASTVSMTKRNALASNSTLGATSSITANGTATSTITLTVKDNNNVAVAGFDTSQLTLASTGSGNTLVAFTGNTNASGQVTTTLKSTVAEVKTLSISADSSGNSLTGIATTTATFVAGAPVSANSTLAATTGVTANGTSTATVTLTLRDTNSNLVSGFNTAQLTLASTGTGNTITAFSGTTNASGQVTTTIASTKAEIKTLSISADSSGNTLTGISTTTSTFVAGAFASLIFDIQPSATGTAGTALSTQPVVKLADANSNPTGTGSGTITLTAYSDASCTTVATGLLATTNPVTASSGTATFAGVKLNKTNIVSIGASDGTRSVCSSAIVISAATATVAVLTGASPTSVGGCAAAYTLTTQDIYGNTSAVSGAKNFTLTSTGSGVFYTNNTCTTSASVFAVGASASSKTYYFKDTVAETVTQTAALAGFTSGTLSVAVVDSSANYVLGQPDLSTNNNARYGLTGSGYILATSGHLYVSNRLGTNFAGTRILMYSSTVTSNQPVALANLAGTSIDQMLMGSVGSVVGPGLGQIATDGTHFLISDPSNRKVQIFNSLPTTNNVTPDLFLGTGTAAASNTNLNSNYGVATDGTHVVVSDTNNNRVLIWNTFPSTSSTPADLVLGQADMNSSGANASASPSPSASTLYVPRNALIVGAKLLISDTGNNRVLIWNTFPTSNQQAADVVIGQPDFVTNAYNTSSQKLNSPQGLYYDGSSLYIADTGNNRVLVYSGIPTTSNAAATYVLGQSTMTLHVAGTTGTGLSSPISVTGTAANNIFVSDANGRVLNWTTAITANGQTANKVIGQPDLVSGIDQSAGATSSTNITNPSGICSDGTALYASDTFNNRILVWNTIPTSSNAAPNYVLGQPDFVSSAANNPSRSLGLSGPRGVKCNANYLAVADTGNSRVLIWSLPITGNQQAANYVLGQPDFTTANSVTTASGMRNPVDITFTASKIAVADNNNNRVLLWNSMPPASGQAADLVLGQPDFVTAVASNSALNTLYSDVNGIHFDGTHLVVSDAAASRTLIWNSWPTSNQQAADFALISYSGSIWSNGTKLYIMHCLTTSGICVGKNRIAVWNTFPTSNQAPDRVIGQSNTSGVTTQPLNSAGTNSGYGGIFSVGTKFFAADYWYNRILIWNSMP